MAIRRSRSTTTGFLRDFRDFALKGNVVELAIAVIIGGAFGKIVSSFVADIVMPLINPLIPGGNWRELVIPIPEGSETGVNLGVFLGTVVDFVLIALILFITIRWLEQFRRKEETQAPPPEPDPAIVLQERLVAALEQLTQVMERRDRS